MNAPLYNPEILQLAASVPFDGRLAEPQGRSEMRSPVCGSRITVDVTLDDAGRVAVVGMLVRACALGQASSALMEAHATGRSIEELEAVRDRLTAWLAGEGALPDWPGFDLLVPALPHRGRHAAIRLPFEAVVEAAARARG
jgi:NifU-like protein involved in Fe-S cluster formation